MKLILVIYLLISSKLYAETDFFGLPPEPIDYFQGISLQSESSNDIVFVVEGEEDNSENTDVFFQDHLEETDTTSKSDSYVDLVVQEAIEHNNNLEYIEALDLLRILNFKMDFNDIKAQYYFARQYIIVLEKKAIDNSERSLHLKKAKHHISKIQKHIENNNLKSEQKQSYQNRVKDLNKRYDAFFTSVQNTSSASPGHSHSSSKPTVKPPRVIVETNDPESFELSQDNLAARKTPIYNLKLTSPDQITNRHAQTILNAMGFMGSDSVHKLSYSQALAAVCNGKTYGNYRKSYTSANSSGCKGIGLNDKKRHKYYRTATMKEYLFEEYQLLRAAVIKYKAYPIISYKQTPKLYDRWIQKAANELTSVPRSQRYALLQSQLREESGRAHWRNFRPIASQAGAVGVAQLLPATAIISSKVNPYDPEGNFVGGAKYLNKMIKRHGSIRDGLAAYNGGGGNVNASGPQRYARNITSRL
ncbi:transglycosylase SLT domain-containing protein [bacterium]|nr:transglycosylase SLT domain-containing protein [bacterium]